MGPEHPSLCVSPLPACMSMSSFPLGETAVQGPPFWAQSSCNCDAPAVFRKVLGTRPPWRRFPERHWSGSPSGSVGGALRTQLNYQSGRGSSAPWRDFQPVRRCEGGERAWAPPTSVPPLHHSARPEGALRDVWKGHLLPSDPGRARWSPGAGPVHRAMASRVLPPVASLWRRLLVSQQELLWRWDAPDTSA